MNIGSESTLRKLISEAYTIESLIPCALRVSLQIDKKPNETIQPLENRKSLLKMYMRPIGILVLALLSARILLADVCLQSDSDVRIREEGDFDTAGGWLTSLLERNLLRIVDKERLSGTGTPVEIVLRTEAPHWQQLPKESRQRITQIDAYSITIRSQPTAQITIAGKTPVAVGYGVLAFLEDKLGMHWAFPGQCKDCLAVGWPNSYYQFVTRVADALRPDYPAQLVGVLAYGDVGIPPHDLNESIHNEEDDRYDGEVKFQWLHANARNLSNRPEGRYLATVSSEGREGLLKLELVSNSRNSATGKIVHAESFWKFGKTSNTKTLRAVIAPETLPDDGEASMVQLRLIWKPERMDSELSGSASLRETVAE